jgi:hypothetical protein
MRSENIVSGQSQDHMPQPLSAHASASAFPGISAHRLALQLRRSFFASQEEPRASRSSNKRHSASLLSSARALSKTAIKCYTHVLPDQPRPSFALGGCLSDVYARPRRRRPPCLPLPLTAGCWYTLTGLSLPALVLPLPLDVLRLIYAHDARPDAPARVQPVPAATRGTRGAVCCSASTSTDSVGAC